MGSGRGQHRHRGNVRRFVSAPEKGTHAGISPRNRASAASLKSLQWRFSRAQPACVCRAPSFFRNAASFMSTRQSLPEAIAKERENYFALLRSIRAIRIANDGWRDRLCQRLFRSADLPDRERSAGSGSVGAGAVESLHLRSNVSRRELQHLAPRERVLDDRTGDGVLRFERQHGSRRRVREIFDRRCEKALPR